MNSRKNARLTVHGRALLVKRVLEEGIHPAEAVQAMGVGTRAVYKWLHRFRKETVSSAFISGLLFLGVCRTYEKSTARQGQRPKTHGFLVT